ncbi:MAG: histidinol-phosphate transaminase [Candidatus Hydrogenedentota bacterium]|nr:MAG: histidinol-phosphate transaminase [Candidatus Hydrogenedentota bacterium]
MDFLANRVKRLKPYTAGEQPNEDDWVKLNTNENPFEPVQAVKDTLIWFSKNLQLLRKYPHPMGEPLRSAFATQWNLPPEDVLITNGSDEALSLICRTCLNEAEAAIYPNISYSLYSTLIQSVGGTVKKAPMRNYQNYPYGVDLEALENSNAKLVFLPNPNAITGEAISCKELIQTIQKSKKLWVIDEAYADFSTESISLIPYLSTLQNVIVTRTFSKSYSLAGLRIGALLTSNKTLMQALYAIKDSYNEDVVALYCGMAALEEQTEFQKRIQFVQKERTRLKQELQKLNFIVLDSEANFYLAAAPKQSGKEFYEWLKAQKILVRYFDHLEPFVRISIGNEAENNVLLKRAKEFISP